MSVNVPSYGQRDPQWWQGAYAKLDKFDACGQAAISDVSKFAGKFVPMGAIRQEMMGSRVGYTTVQAVINWLVAHGYHIRWGYGQTRSKYLSSVRNAVNAGHPVIILQVFFRNNGTGGHFLVTYDVKGNNYYDCDPWDRDMPYIHYGLKEYLPEGEFYRYALGNWWIEILDGPPKAKASLRVLSERWRAWPNFSEYDFVNVRANPHTNAKVVRRLYPKSKIPHGILFTKYTDQGDKYKGRTRWHYSSFFKGWIADEPLIRWEKA